MKLFLIYILSLLTKILYTRKLESTLQQSINQVNYFSNINSVLVFNDKLNFTWSFNHDKSLIKIELSAWCKGWVGIGVSPLGLMRNSDIYIMYVNEKQEVFFKDLFILGKSPKLNLPKRWNNLKSKTDSGSTSFKILIDQEIDDINDIDISDREEFLRFNNFTIFNVTGIREEYNGKILQRFSFIKEVNDKYNLPISINTIDNQSAKNTFIFALRDKDDFTEVMEKEVNEESIEKLKPHTHKSSLEIELLPFNTATHNNTNIDSSNSFEFFNSSLDVMEKVFHFTITAKKVNDIPIDEDSWHNEVIYLGDIVKNQTGISLNDHTAHIIKIEPVIDNWDLLHHMQLFGGSENTTDDHLFVYLRGVKELTIPPNAGFRFGKNENMYMMLNRHFYNQGLLEGSKDASGVKIYYTFKKREHDFGIIVTGRTTESFSIPPRQAFFPIKGICDKKCFPDEFNKTIYLTHFLMHGHFTLESVFTKVDYANGMTNSDMSVERFDTSANKWVSLTKHIPFSYEDSLTTQCNYNTLARDFVTKGGRPAMNEMCLNFIGYYPKFKGSPYKCFVLKEDGKETTSKCNYYYQNTFTPELKYVGDV